MSSDRERIIQIYKSLTQENGSLGPTPINIEYDDTDNPRDLEQRSAFSIDANPPIGFINTKTDSMKKAYFEFWGKYKNIKKNEVLKQCGGFVYDLAYEYIKFSKGNVPSSKDKNDARSQIFRINLTELGYTAQKVCQNVSKDAVFSRIISTTLFPGDIIIYYANDAVDTGTQYKYGHTQIYVGPQIHREDEWLNSKSNELIARRNQQKPPIKNLPGLSGWSSSLRDNYNTNFVYKSKPNVKWDLWIMRAP